MPVHHEKTERSHNSKDVNPRDGSKNRTKQREVSVERRPIISQERPNVSRQTTTKADLKKATQKPAVGKTSTQSKPKVSTSLQSKPKVSSNVQVKPKLPSTTKPTTTELSTKSKRPANKNSPRSSNQGQKLSNKLSKSDYLNEEERVVKTGSKTHDRSRTRTLSPSEVKILPLKKEDLVTKVEDDLETFQAQQKSVNGEETDYDDDFEDYESDFEEDDGTDSAETSTPEKKMENPERKRILVSSAEERERKLDSGSYHISAVPHKKEMEEIKIAMQYENRQKRKQSVIEDADEGYLEGGKSSIKLAANAEFMDFDRAGKRRKEQLNNARVTKRGEELLKMVTLDVVTYSLLDIPAVPYEEFMASFGRFNTIQVHVQTNEDDYDEETQTERLGMVEKWTQCPATFSYSTQKDGSRVYNLSKEERLGVGGESVIESESLNKVNQANLKKSLTKSGQKILVWLEAQNNRNLLNRDQKTSELSCCEAKMVLNQSSTNEKSSIIMTTSSSQHLVLMAQKTKHAEMKIQIWSILTPSSPIKVLMCRQEVTSICFGPGRGDLVFAGAMDGSINLWDLRETIEHHSDQIGRSPTYSTTEIVKQAHACQIVSVIILTKEENYDDFRPIQICSLDLNGQIIVWSVVQQIAIHTGTPNSDLGLAPWGRVRVVKSSSFMANEIASSKLMRFPVMTSRGETGNEILIGTNNGLILHCLTDGSPLKPKFYEPSKNSRPAAVTTISVFSPDNRFFLVGCDDGTIRLHNVNQDKPLINLHWNLMNASPSSSIKALHWFPTKPCMFLAVDATARIHVWNLSVSDIYPQLTVPGSTQNPIISAATLSPKTISQTGSIVFGRSNGTIELHSINTDKDKSKAINEWKKESKMFQRYVKIL